MAIQSINIGMKKEYLDKQFCKQFAKELIKTHQWQKVEADQLAKEIYGHAFIYCHFKMLGKVKSLDKAIYSHVANGVDLDNHVDRFQFAWNVIWLF